MMASPRLSILDVGHGNCAVLADAEGVTVFDAPPRGVLRNFLHDRHISQLAAVVVSHADQDHLAGVSGVLVDPDISIEWVYVNADYKRTGPGWLLFRRALKWARQNKGTKSRALTTAESGELTRGEIKIEVLYPPAEVALGTEDVVGERKLSANALSGVIRLLRGQKAVALLPGDIELSSLNVVLSEPRDWRAMVLVFPHHGGRPGQGDPVLFAKKLCEMVQPELVVFSIGRDRWKNPRPEIVAAVRSVLPGVRIACTQLSVNCSKSVPTRAAQHLTKLPAAGRPENICCAGSLDFGLAGSPITIRPSRPDHDKFIADAAPNALCKLPVLPDSPQA